MPTRWKSYRWLGALIAAGILAFVLQLFVFPDPTSPHDWKDAAEWVEAKMVPEDLIRVSPHWSQAPLVYLDKYGDRVDRRRVLLEEDLFDVAKFWVIQETGRPDPWIQGFVEQGFLEPKETQRFESVEVASFSVVRTPYVYRFSDHLETAVVEQVRAKSTKSCKRWDAAKKRWLCDRSKVAAAVQEIGDEPRLCVYAPPIGKGTTLQITFPDVPLTSRLRLRAGLSLRAARAGKATPVHVKVSVDGTKVWSEEIAFNDETWHYTDVPTSSKKGAVMFEIDSASPKRRFFCVDGFVAVSAP